MGIVADNELAVKNAIMDVTRQPLSMLAHLLGWGWAGGCNSFVGGGMDRTGDGWQAHYDGCGGYMSNVRLGIAYGDWSFGLEKVLWGTPVQSDLTPLIVSGGQLDNWESSTPVTATYSVKVQKGSSVTDTKTSTFNFQSETSFSIEYKPPSATGGVGGSFTEKLTFGRSTTSGQSTTENHTVEETNTFTKQVPAYCRQKWSAVMSRTMSSVTYAAVIRANFSVQFTGFLRWGAGNPNAPNTNYHKDYAGSGKRPRTDGKPWAKFGGPEISFADDLRNKSSNKILPWQWERLFNQHPGAKYYINQLTDTSHYQLTITGRVDNVEGIRVDPRYEAEEYNPAHPQEPVASPQPAMLRASLTEPHFSDTGTVLHVPRFLYPDMQV